MHKLVVVDFHATWCGPCQAIAPLYEKLAARYADRARFLKVDVDEAQHIARKCSVSAMPTFHMYMRGRRVVEFSGAVPSRLQSELERHAPSAADVAFANKGQVLGGSTTATENGSSSANGAPPRSMAEAAAAAAEKRSSTVAAASSTEPPAAVPTDMDSRLTVNPVFLNQLVSEMGFPQIRAEKALVLTGNKSVEQAVTWCFEHADDADIDEPLQIVTEDGTPAKKLSPEEAKVKADELYARARAKRVAEEKAAAIQSEKDRVKSGKQITAAKKEYEEDARKRAVEEKKREKREALAERQRVREMLEADRQRRRDRFNVSGSGAPAQQPVEPSKSKQRSRKADSDVLAGKIQFRMPDGTRIEGDFKPEQTMDDLILFLQVARPELAGSSNLSFSQQYPRRQFSKSEHSLTLGELLLLPRGALTVSLT